MLPSKSGKVASGLSHLALCCAKAVGLRTASSGRSPAFRWAVSPNIAQVSGQFITSLGTASQNTPLEFVRKRQSHKSKLRSWPRAKGVKVVT